MKNVNSYISGAAEAASRRMAAIVVAAVVACVTAWGCTSALVGASRGADGRWLLWKHRDSGHPDNYVRAFQATDSTMAYVGLFNATDTAAREVWIGFNEAGFAVMNTASYNIPAPAKNWQDREGLMMTEALRHCRSLTDFHRLLLDHPGLRGVQANFGAFDAEGRGAYFETSDREVAVFPLDSLSAAVLGVEMRDNPDGCMTRTNYSLSGGPRGCLGMSRHRAEKHLLDSVTRYDREWAAAGKIAAEDLIETLSRSFYLPEKGIDLLGGTAPRHRDSGDVISRRSSCASVVIEGPLPGEAPEKTVIMWTAIGFPTLSVVEAVTLDSVPSGLLPTLPDGHSPICDSVNVLRDKAFLPVSRQPAKGKRLYDFNLDYLRRTIPLRRAESLPRYLPARHRARIPHPDSPSGFRR